MSLEAVRAVLAEQAPELEIVELSRNSETTYVSQTLGVQPGQVAKTLTLKVGDHNVVVLVACGDSRLSTPKVKAELGAKKFRMLPADEAAALTGHPVGGLCPLGLATPLPIYIDVRVKAYDEVVLGAGSTRHALRINPMRMADLVGAQWVDVCH
ncbi:MAG TPA: YbaK/EbsC family protein [Jatrophihabitantaceae bacterium]|jgi:Cys-tRNA(Pro) deacylase|nr:YbaK/EbsC family protein [Jatrophihabitantaceae bacterium]